MLRYLGLPGATRTPTAQWRMRALSNSSQHYLGATMRLSSICHVCAARANKREPPPANHDSVTARMARYLLPWAAVAWCVLASLY